MLTSLKPLYLKILLLPDFTHFYRFRKFLFRFFAFIQYLIFYYLLKRLVQRFPRRLRRNRSRHGKARKFPVAIIAQEIIAKENL
jgi:hypothetical protein